MPWMEQLEPGRWSQAGSVALGAYFLGCLATGYYLVRWRTGQDLRELGSGTLGATNTGRILGPAGFLATAMGDVAKGVLAVWVARHFTKNDYLAALAMLAVVAGHVWPAQLRFRGGKGIATSGGVVLAWVPAAALTAVATWGVVLALSRYVSLASIVAAIVLPFAVWLWKGSATMTGVMTALSLLAIYKHKANIQRLRRGTENRVGMKKT